MFPGKGGISQPPLQQREVHDILAEASRRGIHDSRSKKGCLSWEVRPLRPLPFLLLPTELWMWGPVPSQSVRQPWWWKQHWKPAAERQKSAPSNQITKRPRRPWRSVLRPQNWVWRLAPSRGSVRICRINKMSHWMHACSVTQLRPTLCNPMDCSPTGSSFHGIFQARILAQVAISFSRRSYRFYQPRAGACVSMNTHETLSCLYWSFHLF